MPLTAIDIVTSKRLGLLAEKAQLILAHNARLVDLDADVVRCDQLLATMAANDVLENGLRRLGLVELLPTIARDLDLT